MSNVPHRHTTPEEDISTGKTMIAMFGAGIALCVACLITEGLGMWPIYVPLFICFIGVRIGRDTIKSAEETINRRKNTQIQRLTVNPTESQINNSSAYTSKQNHSGITESYDEESKTLTVRFNYSNSIYIYYDVSPFEYSQLLSADSKQKYINSFIAQNHRYNRIL